MALPMLSRLWECRSSYRIQAYCRKVDGRAEEELVMPLPSILGNLMVLKKEVIYWQKRFPLVRFQAIGCKIRTAQVL
jgi:hypothetical protein